MMWGVCRLALGLLLVLPSTVGMSWYLHGALAQREQELGEFLAAVRLLLREMSYGAAPLPRLLADLAERSSGVAAEFLAAVAERVTLGEDVNAAWQSVLSEHSARWHLLCGDVNVLAELGESLGQTELAGQRRLLALAEERLQGQQAESHSRYLRLGRLVMGLGWCGGLLLICLWL